jgi:hypothetical protein
MLAQHGENAFPLKAFEGFLRDKEAHRVLIDSGGNIHKPAPETETMADEGEPVH